MAALRRDLSNQAGTFANVVFERENEVVISMPTSPTPSNDNPASTVKATDNPNATVVPGKMRSDREQIPGGFSKLDADKAETMEAAGAGNGAAGVFVTPGCQVYWPAPYEVCGAIKDKYNSLGGPNSFLLWPTTNELTNPDNVGKRSVFQNGPIYWAPRSGAHPVVNHFFAAWQRNGWEAGWLGYPTTDEIPAAEGGRRQEFNHGAIYWHFNEAYAVGGAIRDKWNQHGAEGGHLGYPSSDELPLAKYNGRFNNFDGGAIYWSTVTDAHSVDLVIATVWRSRGSEAGQHGYPVTDTYAEPGGQGWLAQDFEVDRIAFYRPF
ncbi:hypothetical protein OG921_12775 [Aldersonia sp. NBC_00410]|uniref:LGFP repeat-containing protein n=1 Tax=Aldersonia sp. NBC_00410 TaxID=2975954 RepID=UPI002250BE08|nr:hypothetical protein [Aldersonia sp. NBC_00410]MCX5044043.1 hypothetical protein [Aldersonia sp. NBC_00410]